MSPESNGSFKDELSRLYDEEPRIIRSMALETDDLQELEQLAGIITPRAFADEFDIDANETAVFVLERIKNIKHINLRLQETQAQKEKAQTEELERRFFEVIADAEQSDE